MDIYLKDNEQFYKNVKKLINSNQKVHFIYNDYDIIDDTVINDFNDWNIKFKVYIVTALNIKDSKERYSYIYDITCSYLDEIFKTNNLCDFIDNKCISVREKSHCKESLNGCCYGTNRGLCQNFKDGTCSIKSISCKLFTCRYLKKHGKKIKINDIPLLKYFFSNRQKYIIDTSIFKDKDEVLELLLKYK